MKLRPFGDIRAQGTTAQNETEKLSLKTDKYYKRITRSEMTISGEVPLYERRLPAEIDIFSNLPKSVYDNADAKVFLESLRRVLLNKILRNEIENISLTRLRLSEQSESGLTIDWIFNYFRLFFSFDSIEGNLYGIIEINDEQKKYKSDVQEVDLKNCELFSEAIVDYVLMMLS